MDAFYPTTGNFIAFVGNYSSRGLTSDASPHSGKRRNFPSEGGAPPGCGAGVGWSDHWSFWQRVRRDHGHGHCDISEPHYHALSDTPDTLDYERMARVVDGLEKILLDLAGSD